MVICCSSWQQMLVVRTRDQPTGCDCEVLTPVPIGHHQQFHSVKYITSIPGNWLAAIMDDSGVDTAFTSRNICLWDLQNPAGNCTPLPTIKVTMACDHIVPLPNGNFAEWYWDQPRGSGGVRVWDPRNSSEPIAIHLHKVSEPFDWAIVLQDGRLVTHSLLEASIWPLAKSRGEPDQCCSGVSSCESGGLAELPGGFLAGVQNRNVCVWNIKTGMKPSGLPWQTRKSKHSRITLLLIITHTMSYLCRQSGVQAGGTQRACL